MNGEDVDKSDIELTRSLEKLTVTIRVRERNVPIYFQCTDSPLVLKVSFIFKRVVEINSERYLQFDCLIVLD